MSDITSMFSLSSIKEWIWTPCSMWPDNKFLRPLRILLRIIYITLHNCHKDLLMLRAGALTYTVILSMVPLLALGTAVLKGLGAGDQIKEAAYTFIEKFETGIIGMHAVPGNHAHEVARQEMDKAAAPMADHNMSEVDNKMPPDMLVHLRRAIDQVFDYVDKTNFATIGIIGVAGLVVIVVALLDSIEEAINAIWKPRKRRPFGRKFMDYLALLIIFPLAVNIGFAAIAALQSKQFLAMAVRWLPFAEFIPLIFRVLPALMVIALFVLMYRFLPNTGVDTISAVAGGVTGGIAWMLVQVIYIKLQIGVARYNAIYGSFATLPLVLIWIYMGWIAFLLGAEVSFATQVWKRYRINEIALKPARRLSLALNTMVDILRAFKSGKPVDISRLSEHAKFMDTDMEDILRQLKTSGLIRYVKDDEETRCLLVPSAPAEILSPAQVMHAVCGYPEVDSWGGGMTEKCMEKAEEVLKKERWPEETAEQHDT